MPAMTGAMLNSAEYTADSPGVRALAPIISASRLRPTRSRTWPAIPATARITPAAPTMCADLAVKSILPVKPVGQKERQRQDGQYPHLVQCARPRETCSRAGRQDWDCCFHRRERPCGLQPQAGGRLMRRSHRKNQRHRPCKEPEGAVRVSEHPFPLHLVNEWPIRDESCPRTLCGHRKWCRAQQL